MILTIGMIVKNEERYLRACLEAVALLRETIDSELIIADTGSTDSTVAIAREFTDKVLSFTWCNDFSAARNFVLEKARGEWFMTLDADEVFESTEEIVSFFSTGEYKKYNSATYIQRNSNDRENRIYSDVPVKRMVRITPQTRYINPIHEQLEPFSQPTRALSSVVQHYGYVVEDNEALIAQKVQRNLDILLTQLQRKPKDSKIYYDLSKSYALSGDYEKAIEFSEKGFILAIEQRDPIQYVMLLNNVVFNYKIRRLDEVLRIAEQYFKVRKKPLVYDLEMHNASGYAHYELKNYEAAKTSFDLYVKAYRDYMNGLLQSRDAYYEEYNANRESFLRAIIMLIQLNVVTGCFTAAQEYLHSVPIDELYTDIDSAQELLQYEFSVMKNVNDFSRLPDLYTTLPQTLREALLNQAESALFDDTYKIPVMTAFMNLPLDNDVGLMKLRYDFSAGGIETTDVENFFMSIDRWDARYADSLYLAVCCGADPRVIAQKVDLFDLGSALFLNKSLHFYDLPKRVLVLCENAGSTYASGNDLWLSMLCFWLLILNQTDADDTVALMRHYAGAASTHIQRMYGPEILDNPQFLPTALRVGWHLHLAFHSDTAEAKADQLRSITRFCPLMIASVKLLLQAFQRENNSKKPDEEAELKRYAAIIKSNISNMIQSGKLEDARSLLLSFEQLCPRDDDLAAIKIALETHLKCTDA